jgi:hypothetical protein
MLLRRCPRRPPDQAAADLRFFNGDDFAPDHWRLYGGVVIRQFGR